MLRVLELAGSPALFIERSKTVREIVSRMLPGEYNYQVNYLVIHHVYPNAVDVETVCVNPYGSVWGNEDRQTVLATKREVANILKMIPVI